jgi:ferredoxin
MAQPGRRRAGAAACHGRRLQHVPTRWSCRTGVCHTCITPLLSGDISYSPDPLELPADGQVLICCAQPATDIVLDM